MVPRLAALNRESPEMDLTNAPLLTDMDQR